MAELCREDLASNKVDEHARTMASMGIGLDPLDPLGADGEPEAGVGSGEESGVFIGRGELPDGK